MLWQRCMGTHQLLHQLLWLILMVGVGLGLGFPTEAAGSVDCVVSRRHVSSRGKVDGEQMNQGEDNGTSWMTSRMLPPGNSQPLQISQGLLIGVSVPSMKSCSWILL